MQSMSFAKRRLHREVGFGRHRKITAALSIAAAGALIAACSSSAGGSNSNGGSGSSGKVYHITFGTPNPSSAIDTKAVVKWAQMVNADTHGTVVIKEYPNDQLGTDATEMTAVQRGSQQGFAGSTADLENYTKVMSAFDLPYTFPQAEKDAKPLLFGSLGTKIADAVAPTGFQIVGWLDEGARDLISKVPVPTPSQMSGVKIRVQQAPVPEAIWKAVGADVDPIAFSDVYTALETNVVSAAEDPIDDLYQQKFYEQAKYLTKIAYILTVNPMVMNKNFWDSLPANDQKIIEDDAAKALEPEWDAEVSGADDDSAAMQKAGVKVEPVDVAQWAKAWAHFDMQYVTTLPAAAQSLYKEIKASEGND
jgi:tripartite ATP-independent transporter DctP family solute receptor